MEQPEYAHVYPKVGFDIDDSRAKSYLAKAREIEEEFLKRQSAGLETEAWFARQQESLRKELDKFCAKEPALPEGWRGPRPAHDVCTLAGLIEHVNDGIVAFHALPPSDPNALELERQAICDAYRAATHLGKVESIPSIDELRDANVIENCWNKLRTEIGKTADSEAASGPKLSSDGQPFPTHSPDFRSVNWFGVEYSFTPNQAACVKVLWEAWRTGAPDVGGDTLLEAADVTTGRIDVVFRGNAAWGAMIVQGGTKGSYRLAGTSADSPKPPKRATKKTSARARK